MKKPEYDYESLRVGVANIEKGIKTLEAAKRGAERQKATAEEVIRCTDEEIQRQVQQRAEFCQLIRQHEKWRRAAECPAPAATELKGP